VSENRSDQASATGTVELTVPADPAYVSVLRAVTASLAARHDLTLDEVDDLRIAVDEACALLLPHARPASALSAGFGEAGGSLQITVSVQLADGGSDAGPMLDQTSFAWTVLTALTESVTSSSTGGRLQLTLSKSRSTDN
jgi:serine/threonine-protein kinase RsbW